MRPALLFLLAASAATGQLATTDDGSVVLLASPWQLQNQNATPPGSSIFQKSQSAGSWETIAAPGGQDDAFAPFVTGDGSIVGWERSSRCFGSCMFFLPRSHAELKGLAAEIRISKYQARISRNGRFLFTPGFVGIAGYELQDLHSGEVWAASNAPALATSRLRPADDGTILGLVTEPAGGPNQPVVWSRVVAWRPGAEPKDLLTAATALPIAISADGSHALIATRGGTAQSETELVLANVDSGSAISISASPAESQAYIGQDQASISNDGTRVLFFWTNDPARLWLWNGVKSTVEQLPGIPEPMLSAVIGGDGRAAWVLTRRGRLFRLTLDNSAAAEEVVSALPMRMGQTSAGSVPGSAVEFATDGPFGGGLVVEAEGTTLPLLDGGTEQQLVVQIPWDFRTSANQNATPMTIRHPGNPFRLNISIFVLPGPWPAFAIRAVEDGKNYAKAADSGFTSLIDTRHPAKPGDTVHTWLFGLGPLDRMVPTGSPGPSDPPAHPQAPLACYLRGANDQPPPRGLVLPFVAYAPGLTGVYQVDVTIPPAWPSGDHILLCEMGERRTSAWIPVGK